MQRSQNKQKFKDKQKSKKIKVEEGNKWDIFHDSIDELDEPSKSNELNFLFILIGI